MQEAIAFHCPGLHLNPSGGSGDPTGVEDPSHGTRFSMYPRSQTMKPPAGWGSYCFGN